MEVLADTLYIVALCDAPSSLPADAKGAAEARYARELERALGGQEQVTKTAFVQMRLKTLADQSDKSLTLVPKFGCRCVTKDRCHL